VDTVTADTLLFSSYLQEKVQAGDHKALASFCTSRHPASVAEALSFLTPEEAWAVFKHTAAPLRVEIFSRLPEDLQIGIVTVLRRFEVAELLSDMPPDDRADLFKQLPDDLREAVLPALAQAEREDIRRLSAHEEGTAGAVMTSDYATLAPNMTAMEAIEHLREIAPDTETIYYAYVVDGERRLLGFVSLKDLIVARRDVLVSDIMNRVVIFVRVDDDQEDAARAIQKYDILALPVINSDDALVGIITHDDAMDIITQEHTEDMERFMAITSASESGGYMKISSWSFFKRRVRWDIALAGLGLISGVILAGFEDTLTNLILLAIYLPMIASMGGNVGGQAATLVIRAMALGEVKVKASDCLQVLWKECKVGILLAVVMGLLAWLKVVFLSWNTADLVFPLEKVGLVVALALGLQVISANIVGALLPMVAANLKIDPAVVASPMLASIVDMSGIIIYFTTAKWILGL